MKDQTQKDGTQIENDINIANEFNNYFVSIASLAKAKLDNSSNSNVSILISKIIVMHLYILTPNSWKWNNNNCKEVEQQKYWFW